jgi:aryl-alcohol dehydrogenase-like predicted oxidoreductase
VPDNLTASVEHANKLKPLVPKGMEFADMALRFILSNDIVNTTIPGMRKEAHVRANIATSDGEQLPQGLMAELQKHRWDRTPTEWSQ